MFPKLEPIKLNIGSFKQGTIEATPVISLQNNILTDLLSIYAFIVIEKRTITKKKKRIRLVSSQTIS